MLVSVVIPTLNEAQLIHTTIARLNQLSGHYEIVMADGGSTDETVVLAQSCGLQVIVAPPGRGSQMNAGAAATRGEAFLFLHADTCLPDNALQLIEAALQAPDVCGGHFNLRFAGQTYGAKVLTRIYPLLRWLGLVYGDSAIFVRRSVFDAVGGFRDLPLFEDCDLYQRLRRMGRFVRLPEYATASSRRFEGRFLRTFAHWTMLQVLYWLGVAPQRLANMYRPLR
jgi:rSAM/selenodomain-associated transferase 2